MNAFLNSLSKSFSRIPSAVSSKEYRLYLFARKAMVLTVLGHVLFTAVCFLIGDATIVWLNVFAVILDIVSLFILLNGRMNLSFSIILTYITLYNSYIIYSVGLNTSFTLYYITLIAFIFITNWKLWAKISFALGMLVCFLIAAYYSFDHAHIVLNDLALLAVNVSNTILCGVVLMLIVFNYEKLTRKAEVELHEMYLSKERLYSIIAHDLRGPIGSVANIADLVAADLKDEIVDPQIVKLVDTIKETSKNTNKLLENLLYWTNSKKGKMKPQIKEVDVKAIFSECVLLHQTQITQKALHVILEEENVKCLGDEEMIFTVFRNLVSNAIKFSEKGGSIGFVVTDSSENITCKFFDNGIGMSQEILSEAFMVNSNKVRKGTGREPGTGLGLVLCEDLIEKCNGKIWIESVCNKGTDVYIQLPKS